MTQSVTEKLEVVLFYHDPEQNNSQSWKWTEVRKMLAVVLWAFQLLKWKAPKSRQSPFSPCDLKTSSIFSWCERLIPAVWWHTSLHRWSWKRAFPEPQHFFLLRPKPSTLGTLHSKWLFSAMFSHSLSFLFKHFTLEEQAAKQLVWGSVIRTKGIRACISGSFLLIIFMDWMFLLKVMGVSYRIHYTGENSGWLLALCNFFFFFLSDR